MKPLVRAAGDLHYRILGHSSTQSLGLFSSINMHGLGVFLQSDASEYYLDANNFPIHIFNSYLSPERQTHTSHCLLNIAVRMSNTHLKISVCPAPKPFPPQPSPGRQRMCHSSSCLNTKRSSHSDASLFHTMLHPAVSESHDSTSNICLEPNHLSLCSTSLPFAPLTSSKLPP